MSGDLQRFVKYIQANGDCWEWTGSLTKGYPAFTAGHWKSPYARYGHRASYCFFKGELIPGMLVMHACDNPTCVNPAHLSQGTVLENNRDSRLKGRDVRGEMSHYAKLKESDIPVIRQLRMEGFTLRQIGRRYGVCEATICNVCRKNNWKHVGDSTCTSVDEVRAFLEGVEG